MGRVLRSPRPDRRGLARDPALLAAGRIHVLPIVHGSPACCARVTRAIATLAPDLVCVELPRDAAPLVPHLRAAQKLPLALFGFQPGGDQGVLPFAEVSPELVAVRAGARVECIDVPLAHVLADRDPAGLAPVAAAAATLGCRTAAELVDRLLADDATAPRLFELTGARTTPTPRERAMAASIRAHAGDAKTTLVVVGAAHAGAIHAVLAGATVEPAPGFASAWELYLVPYDEARLHRTGAQPFPRWRRLVHTRPRAGTTLVTELAVAIGRAARRARLLASVTDEIELVHAARSLAHLRRLREPGLRELLDAVALTMVRDRAGDGDDHDLSAAGAWGPVGPLLERVLVGGRAGEVPASAPRVPIVADVRDGLAAVKVAVDAPERLELDVVRSRLDQARSTLLHRLRYVESPAVAFRAGPDLVADRDLHLLFERWSLDWDDDADAHLLTLAPRGATLRDAVLAILDERIADPHADVELVSRELVAALAMGLAEAAIPLLGRIERLAAREADPAPLWRAASRLALARVSVQSPAPPEGIRAVEAVLVERALAALAATRHDPAEADLTAWLDALHGLVVHVLATGERTGELIDAARGIAQRAPSPLLSGAATAVRFQLGELPEHDLVARAGMQCAIGVEDPAALCRFLLGLLLPGRSLLVRVPALLTAIGRVFASWPEDGFAGALPELRFAFAALSPREVRRVSEALAPPAVVIAPARAGLGAALAAELARLGFAVPEATVPAAPELPAAPPLSALAAARWRLVLGEHAHALPPPETPRARRQDQLLDFLYRREAASRAGGAGDAGGAALMSSLEWLRDIRTAFPAAAADTLERHAIERYRLYEMLRDPALLRQMTPSIGLVTGLLAIHREVPPAILVEIRRIIREVADRVRRALEREVKPALTAAVRAPDRSPLRLARNLDLGRTLRKNLQRIDPDTGALVVSELVFKSRVRRHNPWTLILLVDQSGSMADALVQTTVLAGIFAAVPALATRLIAFDTEPHDLSDKLRDPVELLLATELGGGTHIARALAYAGAAMTEPARSLVVLISDLGEGGPIEDLVVEAARIKESGARLLVLTALDDRGQAVVDPVVRRRLLELDIPVGTRTPAALATWIAEQMR